MASEQRRSGAPTRKPPAHGRIEPTRTLEVLMSSQTVEICQIAGAILILVGFAGEQLGWLDGRSLTYLLFNIIGAGTLAVVAFMDRDWGFLLLEGSWSVISVVSLPRCLAPRDVDVAPRKPQVRPPTRTPAMHSSASAGGWWS